MNSMKAFTVLLLLFMATGASDGQKLIGYGVKDIRQCFFFLSDDSVCRSVRLVCDKSLKNKKIAELNSVYKPGGENQWEEEKKGQKYLIDLKEEEGTFNISISIKPSK